MSTRVDEVTHSLTARIASAGVAAATGAVLALAVWLEPSATGQGTHQQLGLPPCTFYAMSGLPCPMCGATTTFALLAHGRLLEGIGNHPFAAVLCVLTAATFGVATAELLVPRNRWGRLQEAVEDREGWIAALLLVGLVFGWGWRLWLTPG